MFWCRAEVLKPLVDLNLRWSSFDQEACQLMAPWPMHWSDWWVWCAPKNLALSAAAYGLWKIDKAKTLFYWGAVLARRSSACNKKA